MSDIDVYESDMPHRGLSQLDVEILLDGVVPEQDDLASFAAILHSLHHTGPTTPLDDDVASFSVQAAEIARAGRGDTPDAMTPTRPRRHIVLRRQLAGSLGAAALLAGMTGVAVADGAVPGDALYGLDRAMESVGVGASGPPERIAEAQALFQRGQVTAAIAHAAEAFQASARHDGDDQQGISPESANAAEALRGAAERVEIDQLNSDDTVVQDAVAGILNELAKMLDAEGFEASEIGERISEMARGIGRGDQSGSENTQTPSGPPDASPGGQRNPPAGPPDDLPAGPPAGSPADGFGRGRP